MSCVVALIAVQAVAPAAEPSFPHIVAEARALRALVQDWRGEPSGFATIRARGLALAEANLAAHRRLAERRADGDLTCILRGIGEDLPRRIEALGAAPAGPERELAREELVRLLDDDAAVILAPPTKTN